MNRDGPKPGFKGLNGHTVNHPHGLPMVWWRRYVYKLRMGHAAQLRRCRNG